ncbi:DUF4382 domain-containing protein [Ramlibacter sp. 2FC]|uniref:DUF4382 domain-containing protein n=1 Tax=Ramlibacter sp. 2FC TaxID=2502188 RepID=UPI00201D9870|nr:DUF4382 domain-containing protein [Ramlibacter sp. 2FC]
MNEKTGMRGLVGMAPWRWLAAGLTAATLAACGGGGSGGTGTLRVALTDAPSCGYDHVYVTVERVRVHQSSSAGDAEAGWSEIVLSPARRIDLLDLTNGVLEELGNTDLPAGDYQQIRLVLSENTGSAPLANAVQPTGGSTVALDTPSGTQSGLKLQAHFNVPAGQTADVALDFDACKSVVATGSPGKYNLKPVISVIPILTAIEGYVATNIANSGTLVTAQLTDGTRVRGTTPGTTDGKFRLVVLPNSNYSVVVAAAARETAAVTGVPVTTGTTALNPVAAPIAPASSAVASVSGTVTTGSSVPVAGATVRATQALTGGPTIQVASQITGATGGYALSLPLAAPIRAPYAGGAALAFAADGAVAGKYSFEAKAQGYLTQTTGVIALSGDIAQDFVLSPSP